MSQLFNPDQIERPRDDRRTAVMHALSRLKQFRAGRIDLTRDEINRDLNSVFAFVEQVTS